MNSAVISAPGTVAKPSGNTRLRIAVVTPSLLAARGTERATAELIIRLAAEHDVCLFLGAGTPPEGLKLCLHRVPRLPGPGLVHFLSFYVRASRAVRAGEKKHGGYDTVYSPGPNCAQAEVVSAHFCQARQLELFRSGQHRPAPETLRDRATLANRWAYAWVVSRLERRFYSSQQRMVLTPSRLLRQDLVHFYGLSPEQAQVAPLGVDLAEFNPEKRLAKRVEARAALALGADEFAFLFLGNNWLIKGLLHVIHALSSVPGARLLVVGTDVEPVDSWRRVAEDCGVAGRVNFLPRRADVLFYYAAADALVAPSVYDTFGLMPLEAAACALPAIITRHMGVAEVLTPSDATILDTAGDVASLAEAMRCMTTDADLRERLARHACERAKQYPWDVSFAVTLNALLAAAR